MHTTGSGHEHKGKHGYPSKEKGQDLAVHRWDIHSIWNKHLHPFEDTIVITLYSQILKSAKQLTC